MPWRRGNRLQVLPEQLAQGRTGEIYADVRKALGVPCLPVLYEAYGMFPAFLEMHWRVLRPVVETAEFLRLADRIRADAYTRIYNYFEIPDLSARLTEANFSDADQRELTRLTDFFHYSVAVFVLISAIQMQAFDSRTGKEGHSSTASHPIFEGPLTLISEQEAAPNVRKIYDEMKRTMSVPFLNIPYLAFARWPKFLAVFWELLKEVLRSPIYVESSHGVCDTAWALAREVPHPVELTVAQLVENGIAEDDVTALVRITEVFVKVLCGVALNVAVAKIGLDGGTGRKSSRPARQREEKPKSA